MVKRVVRDPISKHKFVFFAACLVAILASRFCTVTVNSNIAIFALTSNYNTSPLALPVTASGDLTSEMAARKETLFHTQFSNSKWHKNGTSDLWVICKSTKDKWVQAVRALKRVKGKENINQSDRATVACSKRGNLQLQACHMVSHNLRTFNQL